MKDRLRAVRKKRKMTIQAFADSLGVSKSTVESYEYGKRQPSTAYINYVCERFDVNKNWLTTGFGDMDARESRDSYVLKALKKARPDMPDNFHNHIADAMSKLSSDDWLFLAKLAQDMAAKTKELKQSVQAHAPDMIYGETVAKNGQRTPFRIRADRAEELFEEAVRLSKEDKDEDLE